MCDDRNPGQDNLTLSGKELRERGVRPDFIYLLESVLKYRNHTAHELLVNDALLRSILGGKSGTLELRHLSKGIYELEQLVVLYDWCNRNNAWEVPATPKK